MLVREIDREMYTKELNQFPDATVFHNGEWIDIVRETYGLDIRYLGFFDDDNALVGLLPVFGRKLCGVRLYGAPLPQTNTPRLFPLLRTGNIQPALPALSSWAEAEGITHLQVSWSDPRVTPPPGARVEMRDTLEVSLADSLDALWKNLGDKTRNRVRKAVRSGVKIHWITRREFVDRYMELVQSTYEGQGLNPNVPYAIYRALAENLLGGTLRILAATYNGQVISAAWLLKDRHTCYFWDGASRQEHRNLSAGNLLQWEIIRWSHKNALQTYDLVGGAATSGRGGGRTGIGQFKQKMGARTSEYAVIYWQGWWVYNAFRLYRLLSRIRYNRGAIAGEK